MPASQLSTGMLLHVLVLLHEPFSDIMPIFIVNCN